MQARAFCKMHGLGNDFVVLDCRRQAFDWTSAEILSLADRYRGIGFDQLLIIENPRHPQVDFTYRIFNADGQEVEHCGNGARCFAKYLRDKQLFDFSRPVRVAVKRGIIEIRHMGQIEGKDEFCVDMGVPDFTPFTAAQNSELYQTIGEQTFGIVSMGNPHAVCEVGDSATAEVAAIGSALQKHPLFPEQVNVGFMQIIDEYHIKLRVFERGVGETQACGTGACAAAAVGIARGVLRSPVRVELKGGSLRIDWEGKNHALLMSGAAESVFEGQLPARA